MTSTDTSSLNDVNTEPLGNFATSESPLESRTTLSARVVVTYNI